MWRANRHTDSPGRPVHFDDPEVGVGGTDVIARRGTRARGGGSARLEELHVRRSAFAPVARYVVAQGTDFGRAPGCDMVGVGAGRVGHSTISEGEDARLEIRRVRALGIGGDLTQAATVGDSLIPLLVHAGVGRPTRTPPASHGRC